MDTFPVSLLDDRHMRTGPFAACFSASVGVHLLAVVLLVISGSYAGCQKRSFADGVIHVDLVSLPGPASFVSSAVPVSKGRPAPTARLHEPPAMQHPLSPPLREPSAVEPEAPALQEVAASQPRQESSFASGLEPDGEEGPLSDMAAGSAALPLFGGKGVFDARDLDAPLVPVFHRAPDYPVHARRHNVEGRVTVSFLVNRQGRVEDVTIVDARPESMFDDSVSRCVARWRFVPGTVGGKPVVTRVITTVRFELKEQS